MKINMLFIGTTLGLSLIMTDVPADGPSIEMHIPIE